MSAESPRHARSGGPLTVPAQPPPDRSIIDAVSGFINDVKLTSSSAVDPKDVIQWARFETADINEPTPEGDGDNEEPPLLLILGYGSGVQVWLIPPNGEAQEVLSWRQGTVRVLRILPTPDKGDCFAPKRPLIALCDSAGPGPAFCSLSFISIRGGEQVKSIKFKNPILDVLANKHSVVVSFSERFAVFCAGSLEDRMAVTTCYPCPCPLAGSSPINPLALGDRWLAYADNKLNPSKRSSGGCEGEGVSSYTAAVLHAAKSLGRGLRGLGESVASSLAGARHAHSPSPPHPAHTPGVLTVLDVHAHHQHDTHDTEEPYDPTIAHFIAHSEPIIALQFDASGLMLVTADRRGHDFHVFRINPHPCGPGLASVHHLYVLHRGDTTAKVQDISISPDSRWVAVSSLRGTTHVFAVSPYGGAAGVRTHTHPRVVNRLSRFHRSAGLPLDDAWFPNPRLPPYPAPTTCSALAQLRATPTLGTHTVTRTSAGRQRLSSLSEEGGGAPLLARAAWGPAAPSRPTAVPLYLLAPDGTLAHLLLRPRPASNIPKEKICDESPIEVCVEGVCQWSLCRSATAGDLLAPLPPASPLLQPLSCRQQCADMCLSSEERWLSQVEIVTHAGPHRRLWMGPQFVFKTFNTGAGGSVGAEEAVEVETGAVSRSNPVNVPAALPLHIDAGSTSSLEQSPSESMRRKWSVCEGREGRPHTDLQLKEDLAEAMKEDHGPVRGARPPPRAVCARAVDPLGTVVSAPAAPPSPADLPADAPRDNCDEATFRCVLRAPANPPPHLPATPLPRSTTIPVQPLHAHPQLQHYTDVSDELAHPRLTHTPPPKEPSRLPKEPTPPLKNPSPAPKEPTPPPKNPSPAPKEPSLIPKETPMAAMKEPEPEPELKEPVQIRKEPAPVPRESISMPKEPPPTVTEAVKEMTKLESKVDSPRKAKKETPHDLKEKPKHREEKVSSQPIKEVQKDAKEETKEKSPKESKLEPIKDSKKETLKESKDEKKKEHQKEIKVESKDETKKASKPSRESSLTKSSFGIPVKSVAKTDTPLESERKIPVVKTDRATPPTNEPESKRTASREYSPKLEASPTRRSVKHRNESSETKSSPTRRSKEREPSKERVKNKGREPSRDREFSMPKDSVTYNPKINATEESKYQKESEVKLSSKRNSMEREVTPKPDTDHSKNAWKKDVPENAWLMKKDLFPSKLDKATVKEDSSISKPVKLEDEIKTEDQAWDMLLNEPGNKPILSVNAAEEKPKVKKNRKIKKSQDDPQNKSEDDSFVEIHAIEENVDTQLGSDDLVSISMPYEELVSPGSYSSKMKKSRSPKPSEKKEELDTKFEEWTLEDMSTVIKTKSPKKKSDSADLITLPETDSKHKEKRDKAPEINIEMIACDVTTQDRKSKYENRKSIEKDTDVKDVYVIDSTKEEFPEIQITRGNKPRKKSPVVDKTNEDIGVVVEKPAIKSWSSIAASKNSKKIEVPEQLYSDVPEKVDKNNEEPKSYKVMPSTSASVSLQDELIRLCKRSDIMVAECDAPSDSKLDNESLIQDLPPLDLDFGLDHFKLDVMRDCLIESDNKITSPICKIDIDNILSTIKESTSAFNLIDLEKVPDKKEKGFNVIQSDKITSQEVKVDDDVRNDKDVEVMEKSSDDDNNSPVLSTDSDKEDKKSSGASNVTMPSPKQSSKSKKSRRKKK